MKWGWNSCHFFTRPVVRIEPQHFWSHCPIHYATCSHNEMWIFFFFFFFFFFFCIIYWQSKLEQHCHGEVIERSYIYLGMVNMHGFVVCCDDMSLSCAAWCVITNHDQIHQISSYILNILNLMSKYFHISGWNCCHFFTRSVVGIEPQYFWSQIHCLIRSATYSHNEKRNFWK